MTLNNPNALPMRPVRDVAPARQRRTKPVYLGTVEAFLESEEPTVEIDLEEVGIKAPALRIGLMKAIDDLGVVDKVGISIRPSVGKAYLMRKDAEG